MKIFSNYPTEVLTLLFLIVTFLQSGIDKLTDWNGNLSFIKGHFKNSPLKNAVPSFTRDYFNCRNGSEYLYACRRFINSTHPRSKKRQF